MLVPKRATSHLVYFWHRGGCTHSSAPPLRLEPSPRPAPTPIAHLKTRRCKIAKMLDIQGMKFEGRLHSGIDDSRNIARIAAKLIEDGSPMYINEGLPPRTAFRDL